MNVKKVLHQLREDPLRDYVCELARKYPAAEETEIAHYKEAYQLYYLTTERLLHEMSLTRRFMNGPRYALRFRCKYTEQEKKIADRYWQIRRYIELDFINFLLHSRILLDRMTTLTQRIIITRNRPSFVSFSDHRKFLLRPENIPFNDHEVYARYLRENTAWFKELKEIRDKFVVHTQQSHKKLLFIKGNSQILLTILIPLGPKEDRLAKVREVDVDIVGITNNIREVQVFVNNYCIEHIQK